MTDPPRLPPKNPGAPRRALEVDAEKRAVEIPPDLAEVLEVDAAAAAGWEKFSYSHQREYVAAILKAKREETRAKRVAEAARAARERSEG